MKINKKAFTLTELLVALAVIGVLIAILMPVIMNIMPNQKDLMAKRAYYTIQTVVSNLLNDSACYPEDTEVGDDELLNNGYGYPDCDLWGGNVATQATITTEGEAGTKFFTLFRDKLQLNPDEPGNPANEIMTLTTKDGMKWAFASDGGGQFTIAVDVNGDDRGNGSDDGNHDGATSDATDALGAGNCPNSRDCDVALFKILPDGDVSPLGNWTTRAVRANRSINSDQ